MLKQLLAPTVFVVAAASVAIAVSGDASTPKGVPNPSTSAATPARTPVADDPVRDPAIVRFGTELSPVPDALAAHLGLSPYEGLLVASLDEDAPEQLEEFDVIVEVNRETADLVLLDRAIARGKGLSLLVVRAGVEHRIAIEAEHLPSAGNASDTQAFLSSDSLAADHPFYQLAAFRELKEDYGTRAAAYRELAGETEARSREIQERAREQMAELQTRGEAEVAAYAEAREAELLKLIDERFDAERVTRVRARQIDLAQALPQDRTERADNGWEEIQRILHDGVAEQLEIDTDDAELEQRWRKQFIGIAQGAGELLKERSQRPWHEARNEAREHEAHYVKRFDENVARTEQTLEGIREQLHERITCAFRRTCEVFSQKLSRRLREMDVPAPGEVEGCLEDVRQQVDRMARRFIRRTDTALERFDEQTRRANDELAASIEIHLPACESALAGTRTELDALLKEHFSSPLVADGSWQNRLDLNELADGVRADLSDLCNGSRNSIRPGAKGVLRAFREHRVIWDDAWRDLRDQLRLIHREAEANCWKIEGPHLDGRFPPASEKPRGELTMVTD